MAIVTTTSPIGHLGRVPTEIRQMILGFAVLEEKPIMPRQVKARSNKFHLLDCRPRSQLPDGIPRRYEAITASPYRPPPTIAALRLVCKCVNQDLDLLAMFYKLNTFQFANIGDITTYIAAIHPRYRAAIQRVVLSVAASSYAYNYMVVNLRAKHLMPHHPSLAWGLLLQACRGLKHLSVDCIYNTSSMPAFGGLTSVPEPPRIRDQIGEVEMGLETFDVFLTVVHHTMGDVASFTVEGIAEDLDKPMTIEGKTDCLGPRDVNTWLERQRKDIIRAKSKLMQPRVPPARRFVEAERLKALLLATELDVWGEARGTEDNHRPGLVSSRTRSQTCRRVRQDGTLSDHNNGLQSNLPWYVDRVDDARVGNALSVAEFRITGNDRGATESTQCWVSLDHLLRENRFSNVAFHIVMFYRGVMTGRSWVNPRFEFPDASKVPHPLDLVDAIEIALEKKERGYYVNELKNIGKAWGDRSPRAEF